MATIFPENVLTLARKARQEKIAGGKRSLGEKG